MKAIIIYNEITEHGGNTGATGTTEKIEGGIYNNISYETAAAEVGENNILYYIPLTIQGSNYQERKNNLEETAKEWQRSNYDFIDWSYGELATIQGFFEVNARRYGLLETFKTEGIIYRRCKHGISDFSSDLFSVMDHFRSSEKS